MSRHAWPLGILAVSGLLSYVTAHGAGPGSAPAAQAAPPELTAARAAIGTPASLGALKSIVLEGVVQNMNHNTGKLGPEDRLEIRILLPDNYLRMARGSRVITSQGFRGETVLSGMRPVQPGPYTSSPPAPGALGVARAAFARLMLGMLGHSATALPLTIRSAPPQGDVRTLEVTGPDGFAAWLDLARPTHMPLQVRFQDDVAFPVPGGTERTVGRARIGSMPPRVQAEVALVFEDRRPVEGLNLPHRIRRVARGVTFEDMRLKRIIVNAPLTAKDFERR